MGRRLASIVGPLERMLWDRSPVILMYHRVAPCTDDLWGIAVEPDRFAEQLEALKRVRRVVSLGQVLGWMDHGRPGDKPLAAITFDDGYHDALSTALPVLEQADCPATVFVATGLVGSDRGFWWDELVRLLMAAPATNGPLRLRIKGKALAWLPPDDPAGRRRVCRQVRRRLRDLEPAEIDRQLDAICAWTGRPVPHFAYPFGHYNRASVAAARQAGFRSACATTPGVVRPWTDPFRLPRIVPGRMDGEALTKLLS